MTDTVKKNVANTVERIAREVLGRDVVDRVHVFADIDADAEPIIRVYVVVNTPKNLRYGRVLPTEQTITVPRLVRNALLHQGVDAFPIISFISKSDAASLSPEAA